MAALLRGAGALRPIPPRSRRRGVDVRACGGGMLPLFVTGLTPDGAAAAVDVPAGATVGDLKAILHSLGAPPPVQQRVCIGTMELGEDACMLADCGAAAQSVVSVTRAELSLARVVPLHRSAACGEARDGEVRLAVRSLVDPAFPDTAPRHHGQLVRHGELIVGYSPHGARIRVVRDARAHPQRVVVWAGGSASAAEQRRRAAALDRALADGGDGAGWWRAAGGAVLHAELASAAVDRLLADFAASRRRAFVAPACDAGLLAGVRAAGHFQFQKCPAAPWAIDVVADALAGAPDGAASLPFYSNGAGWWTLATCVACG
eukprot:gene11182-7343_t